MQFLMKVILSGLLLHWGLLYLLDGVSVILLIFRAIDWILQNFDYIL